MLWDSIMGLKTHYFILCSCSISGLTTKLKLNNQGSTRFKYVLNLTQVRYVCLVFAVWSLKHGFTFCNIKLFYWSKIVWITLFFNTHLCVLCTCCIITSEKLKNLSNKIIRRSPCLVSVGFTWIIILILIFIMCTVH